VLEVRSAVRALESFLEPLDAGNQNGIVHQFIIEPMNLAIATEERLLCYAAELCTQSTRLECLNTRVTTELTDPGAGTPFQFRRKDLIAVALNIGDQGNNSNFKNMVEGYKWKVDDVIAVLDRNLTEQEWLFVNEVYGVYCRLLPEVEEFIRV